jgi:hypothetical protein
LIICEPVVDEEKA